MGAMANILSASVPEDIGDQDFLRQADDEPEKSRQAVFHLFIVPAVLDLVGHQVEPAR